MSWQDRTNAIQGEFVRLFRTFVYDGNFSKLPQLPTVEIVEESGTVFDTLTATTDRKGLYYVNWLVPKDLPPGKYYDRWTFQFDNKEQRTEMTYFHVYLADTFMAFGGSTTSVELTDRTANLINALVNDFIYEAQHIPLYWEQGMRTTDPAMYSFAYSNWCVDPKPLIRKNGLLMVDGWVIDYQSGSVFFETPPEETDDITVAYSFAYFSVEELSSFLSEGLRAMNALPPASWSYRSIAQIPGYWEYGVILQGAIHAMRRLVMGLNFQERSIIFGEDPDQAKAAQQQFQQLYQDYTSLWTEIADGIKRALPSTSMIVVPEYTLPGGRSRWFRYLYTTQGGG